MIEEETKCYDCKKDLDPYEELVHVWWEDDAQVLICESCHWDRQN